MRHQLLAAALLSGLLPGLAGAAHAADVPAPDDGLPPAAAESIRKYCDGLYGGESSMWTLCRQGEIADRAQFLKEQAERAKLSARVADDAEQQCRERYVRDGAADWSGILGCGRAVWDSDAAARPAAAICDAHPPADAAARATCPARQAAARTSFVTMQDVARRSGLASLHDGVRHCLDTATGPDRITDWAKAAACATAITGTAGDPAGFGPTTPFSGADSGSTGPAAPAQR